ncbi:unnamed protein product [marine sediment metagenome]|uniref:Uncharacterized protein n=1 Tax=marine sediment metagenome TaxID=412755 RepID=X1CGN5_9ZZZZ
MENGYMFTYRATKQPFKVGEEVRFESDRDDILKVKVRLTRPVDSHAHFLVHVNGALAGKLCFNRAEWEQMIEEETLVIEVSEE